METTIKPVGPVAQALAQFAANAELPIENRKTRKEMIATCVEAGINKATATTQYGKFHKGEAGTRERSGAVAAIIAIIAANYGEKLRKDILDLCEEAGFNKSTAATQYGKYHRNEASKAISAAVEPISGDSAEVTPKVKGKGKVKE